jgi:hypothetical protein
MRWGQYQYSTFFLTAIASALFIISILMVGYLVVIVEGDVPLIHKQATSLPNHLKL